ncbi:MAG: beta-CASP ribonuclease aCPSF1, partial [Candidatus Thermoplasmatota archaeon]|nr:beta-CASP ribonuclease aCPSF1 [Candidatus Thermoplasmatota archaeon]
MAVEDVIKLVKEVATEVIPDNIAFTDVKVESSNVVLYTPNVEIFSENSDVIRTLAQKVRKRIIIKADPSVRKPVISAKQKLLEVLPEEAEVIEVKFDEINGDVIIEAVNPGRAIGKHGVVLNQVRREIGWNPIVVRSAPMESKTLKEIRNYMLDKKIAEERKKFLTRVGKKVFRDTIEGEQYVRITALGGYREVGRSCHLLMTKDSKVLIDCGFNPGNDKEPSPFLSAPEVTPLEGIDAVVLTHAHLDHSALLPMLFVYGYDGPIYCTPPTRELSSLLQMDFIKIQNAEGNRVPYNTEHIRQAIRNTITLNYGDTTDISPDLKLTFHNSGHILGSAAAHFHVGDGLYNLVFSGDIKFENTWLFDRAVNHFPRLEGLVMESTYGGYKDFQPARDEGTRNLTEIINRTVDKKGKILIPVFAVGRSQEVMLVLEKAYSEGKLQDTPVYLDGMIWEATALHSAYPEYLNNNLRNKI